MDRSKLRASIASKINKAGVKGVNKPKLTRSHKTKKAVVVSTLGPGQDSGKVIRFGDQKMGHNYSPKARTSFKSRHAKNIKRKGSAAYWANRFLWAGKGGGSKRPPKSQKRTF
tara:strand:- start:2995 stop:3333 length:339 start_codon:yes stop_codon:yes gene_type:complete